MSILVQCTSEWGMTDHVHVYIFCYFVTSFCSFQSSCYVVSYFEELAMHLLPVSGFESLDFDYSLIQTLQLVASVNSDVAAKGQLYVSYVNMQITKSGKYSTALSHFNELQLKDIELDLYTFNIAINCYCCANRVGFGFSLLGSIFKRCYTPNVVTFTTLLNRLVAQDKAGEALSLFNKLQLQDIEINLYSFNIAINCYCCTNRVGFGFSLLGSIFKRGYTPCVVTFTSLLNGLIVHDKTVEAVEFFEIIVKKGEFKPDASRYGSFINRLCKMGNKGAAISFLRIAEDGGLKPNTTTYSMIIDRLCKDGMVDDGVYFLVEMKSKGIRANVVTYNSLIDGLCKHGKWKEATGMLREMVDSGISPDVCTSTVLVSALCKQGMIKKAEELLEDMIAWWMS
ncbi:pentatricopeptide repeat-containing protein At1g62910-like [Rhododendron vialii]|uniref:pentatricopeptide repeat-containing protein At1g62910-like n=1 Tax=Rhododendron vialii TaxID=182163 RepID=UPI00265F8737|nr:pentatricopeptide repeat-containing protein At1g62910-like [Rhododendron vialii]